MNQVVLDGTVAEIMEHDDGTTTLRLRRTSIYDGTQLTADIEAGGRLAEFCALLSTGARIRIVGRLRNRSAASDGLVIVAEHIETGGEDED